MVFSFTDRNSTASQKGERKVKLLIASVVLFLVSLCGLISYAVYRDKVGLRTDKKKGGVHRKSKKGYGWIPLSFLSFAILLFGSVTSVSANSVGIIFDEVNGGIQERTYKERIHVKSIFEQVIPISTANRSAIVSTTGQTNDGQYATFELSIIYKIEQENAGKFYKVANGDDIPKNALETIIKSSLQSSTIKFNIFELLSTELENARIDFRADLGKELSEQYWITLVDVSFDEIDGGEEVEEILQASAKAQQEIDIARLQAEASLITADNESEIKKILSDAEAYAIVQEGNAKGEAEFAFIDNVVKMVDHLYLNTNQTLSYEECSSLVLSIVFYDTWDGQLPEVLTSDSLSSMIGSLIGK